MLTKEFFNRDTNITAKIVCDSVSEQGHRITTFELEYNRYIHGELLTNRIFSRNCSSSRAIPIKKMIEYTQNNMAMPLYYGSAKSGMQAGEELESTWLPKFLWKSGFFISKSIVKAMDKLKLHKQIPNRLLEPWQMIKVVVTATDFDNFFNLRIEGAAQPEIAMLAHKMYQAREASKPKLLKEGQYHLPYVDEYVVNGCTKYQVAGSGVKYYKSGGVMGLLSLEEAIRISAASCAAQSYRTESMTLEKANKIFDMLIKDKTLHASPFENIATPIVYNEDKDTCDYTNPYLFDRVKNVLGTMEGVTHIDKNGDLHSGNFKGWIQYRHLLDNNTCYNFNYEERVKEFN
ncbi:Thymidylate synthase [Psychrobacter phage D'Alembert]|nr:Thymidylate synthase [Psychrobacter phage D'Alembert]